MNNYLKSAAILLISMLFFPFCNSAQNNKNILQTPSKVEIKAVEGDYNFYVDGELFMLKGAGGGNDLAKLHDAGGNSLRTWSSRNGLQLLDSAYKYNIMIAMGLSMGQELHGFDYNDTAAVAKQFRRNIAAIGELKNHPNLLCWVVGNELNLSPKKGVPVNPKVYDAVKDIVDYIHKNDPNHPATTPMAGVNRQQVQVALDRCPNLDFISVQVYGGLGSMAQQIKAAGINIPFAITEYGPIGHWERPQTKWGREIEETSAQKATGLYTRIQNGIVNDPTGLCLGGYAFLWGQKQERTPTWYGIFLKTGEATAIVDELTHYWTGEYAENRAPQLDSMKIDGKNAVDNIYLKPGKDYTAKVFVSEPNGDKVIYKWELLKEVVERSQGGAFEKEPGAVDFKINSDSNGELNFIMPSEKGEYRLFSYIFDGKGKVGTANVPFYVE